MVPKEFTLTRVPDSSVYCRITLTWADIFLVSYYELDFYLFRSLYLCIILNFFFHFLNHWFWEIEINAVASLSI